MKIIYRKHASKFVYGLFKGCGLVACVSLTACGNNKKNQKTPISETLYRN